MSATRALKRSSSLYEGREAAPEGLEDALEQERKAVALARAEPEPEPKWIDCRRRWVSQLQEDLRERVARRRRARRAARAPERSDSPAVEAWAAVLRPGAAGPVVAWKHRASGRVEPMMPLEALEADRRRALAERRGLRREDERRRVRKRAHVARARHAAVAAEGEAWFFDSLPSAAGEAAWEPAHPGWAAAVGDVLPAGAGTTAASEELRRDGRDSESTGSDSSGVWLGLPPKRRSRKALLAGRHAERSGMASAVRAASLAPWGRSGFATGARWVGALGPEVAFEGGGAARRPRRMSVLERALGGLPPPLTGSDQFRWAGRRAADDGPAGGTPRVAAERAGDETGAPWVSLGRRAAAAAEVSGADADAAVLSCCEEEVWVRYSMADGSVFFRRDGQGPRVMRHPVAQAAAAALARVASGGSPAKIGLDPDERLRRIARAAFSPPPASGVALGRAVGGAGEWEAESLREGARGAPSALDRLASSSRADRRARRAHRAEIKAARRGEDSAPAKAAGRPDEDCAGFTREELRGLWAGRDVAAAGSGSDVAAAGSGSDGAASDASSLGAPSPVYSPPRAPSPEARGPGAGVATDGPWRFEARLGSTWGLAEAEATGVVVDGRRIRVVPSSSAGASAADSRLRAAGERAVTVPGRGREAYMVGERQRACDAAVGVWRARERHWRAWWRRRESRWRALQRRGGRAASSAVERRLASAREAEARRREMVAEDGRSLALREGALRAEEAAVTAAQSRLRSRWGRLLHSLAGVAGARQWARLSMEQGLSAAARGGIGAAGVGGTYLARDPTRSGPGREATTSGAAIGGAGAAGSASALEALGAAAPATDSLAFPGQVVVHVVPLRVGAEEAAARGRVRVLRELSRRCASLMPVLAADVLDLLAPTETAVRLLPPVQSWGSGTHAAPGQMEAVASVWGSRLRSAHSVTRPEERGARTARPAAEEGQRRRRRGRAGAPGPAGPAGGRESAAEAPAPWFAGRGPPAEALVPLGVRPPAGWHAARRDAAAAFDRLPAPLPAGMARHKTGAVCLVKTPRAPGMRLSDALVRSGPLSGRQVHAWLLQACEAVAALHAAGIAHGAVCPASMHLRSLVPGSPLWLVPPCPLPAPGEAGWDMLLEQGAAVRAQEAGLNSALAAWGAHRPEAAAAVRFPVQPPAVTRHAFRFMSPERRGQRRRGLDEVPRMLRLPGEAAAGHAAVGPGALPAALGRTAEPGRGAPEDAAQGARSAVPFRGPGRRAAAPASPGRGAGGGLPAGGRGASEPGPRSAVPLPRVQTPFGDDPLRAAVFDGAERPPDALAVRAGSSEAAVAGAASLLGSSQSLATAAALDSQFRWSGVAPMELGLSRALLSRHEARGAGGARSVPSRERAAAWGLGRATDGSIRPVMALEPRSAQGAAAASGDGVGTAARMTPALLRPGRPPSRHVAAALGEAVYDFASPEDDVFALGCLAWRLATGDGPPSMDDGVPLFPNAANELRRVGFQRLLLPFVRRCTLSAPAARPTALQLVQFLRGASEPSATAMGDADTLSPSVTAEVTGTGVAARRLSAVVTAGGRRASAGRRTSLLGSTARRRSSTALSAAAAGGAPSPREALAVALQGGGSHRRSSEARAAAGSGTPPEAAWTAEAVEALELEPEEEPGRDAHNDGTMPRSIPAGAASARPGRSRSGTPRGPGGATQTDGPVRDLPMARDLAMRPSPGLPAMESDTDSDVESVATEAAEAAAEHPTEAGAALILARDDESRRGVPVAFSARLSERARQDAGGRLRYQAAGPHLVRVTRPAWRSRPLALVSVLPREELTAEQQAKESRRAARAAERRRWRSAVRVQAWWRGEAARLEAWTRHDAAADIQAGVRGWLFRRREDQARSARERWAAGVIQRHGTAMLRRLRRRLGRARTTDAAKEQAQARYRAGRMSLADARRAEAASLARERRALTGGDVREHEWDAAELRRPTQPQRPTHDLTRRDRLSAGLGLLKALPGLAGGVHLSAMAGLRGPGDPGAERMAVAAAQSGRIREVLARPG